MSKPTVLVVDDSPQEIRLIIELLQDEYAIVAATTGDVAIDMAARENRPDVILMDVMMPGMNGYEVCKCILKNDGDADVIFVSANSNTEEIMRGYDVGGIDYVTKPFSPDILSSKIDLAIKNRKTKTQLAEDAKQATNVALTAISSTGELSEVIHFMRASFSIQTAPDLARALYQTLQSYGLNSCIQLRTLKQTYTFAGPNHASALEKELLSRMQEHPDRLFESGARLFVNCDNVNILIKNMPTDNSDKHGRLRDHLVLIAEVSEEKLKSIALQTNCDESRVTNTQKILAECTETLYEFQKTQEEHRSISVTIFNNMITSLGESFMILGLTEEQEEDLKEIINAGIEEALKYFDSGARLDEDLKGILSQLEYTKE